MPLESFESLFCGELLHYLAFPASQKLAAWGRSVVAVEFGDSPESLSSEAFRQALDQARAVVAGAKGRRLAGEVLSELIPQPKELRLDVVRLRAITPGLEKVEAAAPAFYAHRDTWYGNPRCQVNAWVPLIEANPSNSFRFFLDDFNRPVANDSEHFDAGQFQTRGGFGRTASDPVSAYPRALEESQSRTYDVALEADGLLLFSAAHLHQTLPNRTAKVRFSLDFRVFRQCDRHNGLGAPDPDNRSRGSFADSYLPC